MYSFIFFLLLLSTITPLFGRYLGNFAITITIYSLILCFFISLLSFYEVIYKNFSCEILIFNWIQIYSLYSPFILIFDKLSTSMLVLVIFISLLVHIYASNYMETDPHKLRFFFFLSLFTFFMCLMVVSGSLLQFFLSWEGVGLSSYLLINFWYTRSEANRSAMKAMLVNRIGDFGLYFSIFLIFSFYKTLLFNSLNSLAYNSLNLDTKINFLFFNLNIHEFICFFLFIAVVGKSAQLGLHTWLPDAMEGPTPVSALLHAATMVTAGVYLLLRLSYILEFAPNILLFIAFWGSLTAFFASTVGAFQYDIKKIIAYSTCSQLGYMVSACGLNNFIGSYYHLFNHAFFKALLFLGAGSVIHSVINEQDIRKYGKLINYLPVTYFCMFVGSFALMGLPFLSGYYSKDIILNWSYTYNNFISHITYWFLLFAAFFTAYYSTKLLYLTFFSNSPRFSKKIISYTQESDYRFIVPLTLLAFFSIFSGYIFYDLFIGYGTNMLNFPINLTKNYYFDIEFLTFYRKLLPIFFILMGIFSYIIFSIFFQKYFFNIFPNIHYFYIILKIKNFFVKKWFFDYFYFFFSYKTIKFSYNILFKSFDKGILEDFFAKKPVFFLISLSNIQNYLQTSNINDYSMYIVNLFLFLILLFYIFSFVNFIFVSLFFSYVFYKLLYYFWRK